MKTIFVSCLVLKLISSLCYGGVSGDFSHLFGAHLEDQIIEACEDRRNNDNCHVLSSVEIERIIAELAENKEQSVLYFKEVYEFLMKEPRQLLEIAEQLEDGSPAKHFYTEAYREYKAVIERTKSYNITGVGTLKVLEDRYTKVENELELLKNEISKLEGVSETLSRSELARRYQDYIYNKS